MDPKVEQLEKLLDSKIERFINSIWGILFSSLCTLVTMAIAIRGLIIGIEKHNMPKIGTCCFLLAVVTLGIFQIVKRSKRLLNKQP